MNTDEALVRRGLGSRRMQPDLHAAFDRILAHVREVEAERDAAVDRLAAYVAFRQPYQYCLCDECVAAITKRLNAADALLAALDNLTALPGGAK